MHAPALDPTTSLRGDWIGSKLGILCMVGLRHPILAQTSSMGMDLNWVSFVWWILSPPQGASLLCTTLSPFQARAYSPDINITDVPHSVWLKSNSTLNPCGRTSGGLHPNHIHRLLTFNDWMHQKNHMPCHSNGPEDTADKAIGFVLWSTVTVSMGIIPQWRVLFCR